MQRKGFPCIMMLPSPPDATGENGKAPVQVVGRNEDVKKMKWTRKLGALLLLVFTVSLVSTGCFGFPATSSEDDPSIVSQTAPPTPQNLRVTVREKRVTLKWDRVPEASGYIVSLYDSTSKRYTDIATLQEAIFTYDGEKDTVPKLSFGVCAYTDVNENHRLYSDGIAKITANIVEETVAISREKATVQVDSKVTLTASSSPDSSLAFRWESSDPSIAKVNNDGVVTGMAQGKATITATATNGLSAQCAVTVTAPTEVVKGKLIALTFDDGPNYATTGKLLDGLKKHKAKATFFMLGQNVAGNEDLVQRMKKEGHELGNHSWDHAQLTELSQKKIQNEVNKTNEAVYAACGAYPTVFRAPYGSLNDKVLSNVEIPSIYWSVDTLDWKNRNANYVKKQILKSAYDGAIILLHDIHETTVKGVLAALDTLEKEGYTMVTVTQLLSRHGETPQAGTTYVDDTSTL